jgi:phosphonate transport system substrate-binding protein
MAGRWSPARSGNYSRRTGISRRHLLAAGAATAAGLAASPTLAEEAARIGLTPVLLDSDMLLLRALEEYFRDRLHRPVELVRRRTYQEISMMLLSGQLDAAWICGFPYVQHRDQLALVAVPVYLGKPLYQSYVIINGHNPAQHFDELRGQAHAFSDPDSNSGFLVTRALLAEMGERPDTFFRYHFFTYGHRNVIRAVAAGLADCGSVDGYVYDVVHATEPDVVRNTRVIRRSEWLGFPPIACHQSVRGTALVEKIADAFLSMDGSEMGREILEILHLDGFAPGEPSLFDGIAAKYELVRRTA